MLSTRVKHKAFKRRSNRKGQGAGVYNSTIREVDEDNTRDLFFGMQLRRINVLHDWWNGVGMEHRLANAFLHDW